MERNDLLKEVWSNEYIIDKTKRTGWTMNDYHFHDHFEINFSLTDQVRAYINGQFYEVHRGTLILCNHMDLHKIVVPPDIPYERYVFHFKPEFIDSFHGTDVDLLELFLNRPPDFCPVIQLNQMQIQKILPIFDKAVQVYENPVWGNELYNKILLVELLLNIIPLYRSRTDLPIIGSKHYAQIQPVLKYIHENLASQLHVDNIAAKFYLSTSYLEYLFKQVTGSSINKYIIYRRILKARELLKKNQSVSSVGDEVGFNSVSHFIRTFKKIVGVSPKQYAKNQTEYFNEF